MYLSHWKLMSLVTHGYQMETKCQKSENPCCLVLITEATVRKWESIWSDVLVFASVTAFWQASGEIVWKCQIIYAAVPLSPPQCFSFSYWFHRQGDGKEMWGLKSTHISTYMVQTLTEPPCLWASSLLPSPGPAASSLNFNLTVLKKKQAAGNRPELPPACYIITPIHLSIAWLCTQPNMSMLTVCLPSLSDTCHTRSHLL